MVKVEVNGRHDSHTKASARVKTEHSCNTLYRFTKNIKLVGVKHAKAVEIQSFT